MSLNHTLIDWVKNPDVTQGFTWNPITGCLNHVDGICKGGGFPCYAYKLAHGRTKNLYLANDNLAPLQEGMKPYSWNERVTDPFYPREWFARRERGLESKKSKGVFVCDMSDLFGIGIPESWTDCVLQTIKVFPEHRFYLLTKQPQNLAKFSPFPDNCWVGVTVTANGFAPEAYYNLSSLLAKVKYISFEPLLGQIGTDELRNLSQVTDWWIVGSQTKPYKPPRIEWITEIVEAADKSGVKVFMKNNLWPIFEKGTVACRTDKTCLVSNGTLRQEFPRKD